VAVVNAHVIEIYEDDDDRAYWECDCGRAGSGPSYKVDIAAEKHIPEGELATYRYRAKDLS
jgi:hypothetical protein